MPLYMYECAGGHRFEDMAGYESEPLTVCPGCDEPCHRVIGPVTVVYR